MRVIENFEIKQCIDSFTEWGLWCEEQIREGDDTIYDR